MPKLTPNAQQNLLAGSTLALGIVILWLHPADQYFFGDSLSTLLTRSLTWRAAFLDFFRLGGSHWYRPLTNGFVQFLLWPLFGLNFMAYHLLAMFLHWSVCFGLYLALKTFLEDAFAAWVGAAFYAFHPIGFYASYDVCFYQEPLGAGLILGAVAFLYWYVQHGQRRALIVGMVFFVLALTAREVAVFTPGLLVILLWPASWRELNLRRAAWTIGVTGAAGAAFTAMFLFVMHPLRYQPPDYSSDWSPAHLAANLWTCIRWAFGIAAGPQTGGWRSPGVVRALLWMFLVAAVLGVVAFWGRRPAIWKGPAFFCAAAIAALSTHRLWPHHLYLPMMGVALWVGACFACARARARSSPHLQKPGLQALRFASALVLSCLFVTSAIAAGYDSVDSWVGLNSWETRLPVLYSRALFRDLPNWRGLWIVVKNGDPSFSWLYGGLFRLMAGSAEYNMEARLMPVRPESAPRGIHVFEYRDSMLYLLAIPESAVAPVPAADVRVAPMQVHPGTSYTIAVPALAGRSIDLRYSYNDHLPAVAYAFAQLKADGSADVFTPRETPWGVVEILGVRPSGAAEWSKVSVKVEVLRD
jgi:hypothetical protein